MPVVRVIASTPRGRVITIDNGKVTSRLEWNDNIQRFNGQFGRAQIWLDNAVLKDSTPYVPMRTGALYKTGILGTTPGEGVVQWIAPYAHYLYKGKVVVGPKYGPKYATNKDLNISKSEHPNAQPFWFEAAKAQNKPVWVRGAQRIAGGG